MTEIYSVISDFGGVDPNISQLHTEIVADPGITKTLQGITTMNSDAVHITFDSALSAPEKTVLDGLVAAHIPVPKPDLDKEIYDAIVDSTGAGDFKSIAAAFLAGNKSVFVRDGIYVETSDIIIPDTGKIIGESSAQVIISFNGGSFSITADGSGGVKETVGTISATNGLTAVTGSGTTFTNLSAGDYILLDQNFYEIGSITNDTTLDIVRTYNGRSFSTQPYIAHSMYLGITLCNFIVTGSTGAGIFLRGLRSATITSVASVSNNIGFEMLDSSTNSFVSCNAFNNNIYGFKFTDTHSTGTVNGESYNNTSDGFQIDGRCSNIVCNGNLSANNGGIGVNIVGTSTSIVVTDCVIQRNNGIGVNTDASTGAIVIDGCTIAYNGGDGVDFDGGDNLITSCHLCYNGGFGIRAGDNGIINGNHINDNGDHGINMQADSDCQVVGNNIHRNIGHGIFGTGHRNTITGNSIRTNTIDGINISGGDDNVISSNIIQNNTGDGIEIVGNSDRTSISGNRIIGNGMGVNIPMQAIHTSLLDNIITGTSADGISVSGDESQIISNITDAIGGTGCIINGTANSTTLRSNNLDSFTNNGTNTNSDQTFIGDYNTAAGTDSGLVIPYSTFVYEITVGTETAPFALTGPSAITGQILNIRNNTAFATTGLVVATNGGATYIHNGTSWILISST